MENVLPSNLFEVPYWLLSLRILILLQETENQVGPVYPIKHILHVGDPALRLDIKADVQDHREAGVSHNNTDHPIKQSFPLRSLTNDQIVVPFLLVMRVLEPMIMMIPMTFFLLVLRILIRTSSLLLCINIGALPNGLIAIKTRQRGAHPKECFPLLLLLLVLQLLGLC